MSDQNSTPAAEDGDSRTLKPWVSVAIVGAITAVAGFGVGRVTAPTTASEPPVAASSASPAPVEAEATGPALSDEEVANAEGSVPMGQQGNSDGLKLTVRQVTEVPSIQYVTGKTLTPPKGGKIILVETKGLNDTKNGIDLTCSFPVRADLLDSQGRRFEGVNDVDLYDIKGNPGCNDSVQPGFPFNMTWAYIVPSGADITTFEFSSIPRDFNDGEGPVVSVPVEVS